MRGVSPLSYEASLTPPRQDLFAMQPVCSGKQKISRGTQSHSRQLLELCAGERFPPLLNRHLPVYEVNSLAAVCSGKQSLDSRKEILLLVWRWTSVSVLSAKFARYLFNRTKSSQDSRRGINFRLMSHIMRMCCVPMCSPVS